MKGPLGVERVRMPLFASKSFLSTIGAVTVTESCDSVMPRATPVTWGRLRNAVNWVL